MLGLERFQKGRLTVFPFRKVLKTSPKLLQIHVLQSKRMDISNVDFSRRRSYGTNKHTNMHEDYELCSGTWLAATWVEKMEQIGKC